jgi:cell wall-associated NlpC family hydrolase
MSQAQIFADHVRECLGVPFLRGGRDKSRGLDCVGIIHYALNQMGIEHDDAKYALTGGADQYQLLTRCLSSCFIQAQLPFQVGDVLAYKHPGSPGHAMVFVREICKEKKFIECVPGRGVQERSILTDWLPRIEKTKGQYSLWRLG